MKIFIQQEEEKEIFITNHTWPVSIEQIVNPPSIKSIYIITADLNSLLWLCMFNFRRARGFFSTLFSFFVSFYDSIKSRKISFSHFTKRLSVQHETSANKGKITKSLIVSCCISNDYLFVTKDLHWVTLREYILMCFKITKKPTKTHNFCLFYCFFEEISNFKLQREEKISQKIFVMVK